MCAHVVVVRRLDVLAISAPKTAPQPTATVTATAPPKTAPQPAATAAKKAPRPTATASKRAEQRKTNEPWLAQIQADMEEGGEIPEDMSWMEEEDLDNEPSTDEEGDDEPN